MSWTLTAFQSTKLAAQSIDCPSVPFAPISSTNYLFLALQLLRAEPDDRTSGFWGTLAAAETWAFAANLKHTNKKQRSLCTGRKTASGSTNW